MKGSKKRLLVDLTLTLAAWIILVAWLTPFIWMVCTSFKPIGEWGLPHLFPRHPTLRNYRELTTGAVYGVRGHFPAITPYFINSIVVSLVNAFVSTILGAMTAYAIQRFRVGGTGLAGWILSLRMIPPVSVMVPLVVLTKFLGLYNTIPGLLLVYPLITIPITTWFMIGAFKGIPRDAEEAALTDGATELQAFFLVVLPQAGPSLATAFMFAFLFSWSEFLIPLFLAPSEASMTLTVFAAYFSNQYGILWGPLAATGVVVTIPVIVIGLILQKYVLRGFTLGIVR